MKLASAFTHSIIVSASLLLILSCSSSNDVVQRTPGWYSISSETKPWTRWWWHGSALTKEGITAELEAFQKAGIGGVEITPIYGVYGYEDKFISYLSPEWMNLLSHVFTECKRLGLGVDMATGTGWPFGGPWVNSDDACKTFHYKIYHLRSGQRLNEKIAYIQEPYLRVVGNQRYEIHDVAQGEKVTAAGTRKEPVLVATQKKITINDITDPVSENKNLQALAIDQVQFEKPLKLKLLMAYTDHHHPMDLTSKVDQHGILDWTPPAGEWKLYAIFEAWHGKMVERAGPGGEGNVIDHFSTQALDHYLAHFDSAFHDKDLSPLRAFFNDSYEVDDARGSADFTPKLFDEFLRRRGYDLRHHLPAWLDTTNSEYTQRIRADYRETISELVLENFTQRWKNWAHKHSMLVRNQAHGSPANILDLYSVVDIPEIEGTDPLRFRMASSSGNITGKKLVSAEAVTWHDEHFKSKLNGMKTAMDNFMLNGVNHLVYHGTAYSPQDEPWPGWLFYAAVHVNPRNPFWNDIDALNLYIARCQSFLQNTKSVHDVLLYYPIHDRFADRSEEMIEHFDGIGKQFAGTSFATIADTLLQRGYGFDFISDKQIQNLKTENGLIITEGNAKYKTIIVPECKYMPLSTLKKFIEMAEKGNVVIFIGQFPKHATGYLDAKKNDAEFTSIIQRIKSNNSVQEIGKGKIIIDVQATDALSGAQVERETIVDDNIQFYRKKNNEGQIVYFIRNGNKTVMDKWLPLTMAAEYAVMYDPMNASFGNARVRQTSDGNEIFVQLQPDQSLIIECYETKPSLEEFPYIEPVNDGTLIEGTWSVTFLTGGPTLPPAFQSDSLMMWTTHQEEEYNSFSGTGIYSIRFDKPKQMAKRWLLKFSDVSESAEVLINNKLVGTMIGPVYQISFDDILVATNNVLEVRVSNSMANRIISLDKKGVSWKKFYNINFPARKPENVKNNLFDASGWIPEQSGLTGTVWLIPIK